MPPNNSNSKSALSRQMQPLRRQVDRIDLKMLQLLQQRTELSGRIGAMKRRLGAVVYVPERERELVARLTRQSKGRPPARAVAALYREIMSSSRAAQGQAPIGVLQSSAAIVLPAGRACFGACDEFCAKKTWSELAAGLASGALSLALLTGDDLLRTLATPRWRAEFCHRLEVVGDFSSTWNPKPPLAARIFIVTPRGNEAAGKVDRILILIECKSTPNAIKSLLHAMPDFSLHAERLTRRTPVARRGMAASLAWLSFARPITGSDAGTCLQAGARATGLAVSILGIYPAPEDYAG
jgi:chorismate mutase